jgi:hypothetical protein
MQFLKPFPWRCQNFLGNFIIVCFLRASGRKYKIQYRIDLYPTLNFVSFICSPELDRKRGYKSDVVAQGDVVALWGCGGSVG